MADFFLLSLINFLIFYAFHINISDCWDECNVVHYILITFLGVIHTLWVDKVEQANLDGQAWMENFNSSKSEYDVIVYINLVAF